MNSVRVDATTIAAPPQAIPGGSNSAALAIAAAASARPCVCEKAFFFDAVLGVCVRCPDGATCVGGAIYSLAGYWRPAGNSAEVYNCITAVRGQCKRLLFLLHGSHADSLNCTGC